MSTWNEKLAERLSELESRLADERDNLSDFRKDEAVYLALTPDEQAEMSELQNIRAAQASYVDLCQETAYGSTTRLPFQIRVF